MRSRADVVVVGAGLSGLQAARDLEAAGFDVVVLEARERPGGRVLTVSSPSGTAVDLGAVWFDAHDRRMSALVEELGLTVVRSDRDAGSPRGLRARLSSLRGPSPRDRLAEAAGTSGSWTFDEWLRRNVRGATSRESFCRDVGLAWGAEPAEISVQDAALACVPGPRLRLAEGMQALADRMVGQLTPGRVCFDAAVHSVRSRPDGVLLRSEAGVFAARAAVIAVPPHLAARLAFEPALPPAALRLASRVVMGAAVSAAFFFDVPPALRGAPDGVDVVDMSDGALALGLRGRRALAMSEVAEADRPASWHRLVAGCLAPGSPEPVGLVEIDWTAEPFTAGGPAGFLAPGSGRDARERLRRPHGRVHWAGGELDDVRPHRMEGALASGARAAAEVAALLVS